jgi:hypothetical protein
VIIGDATTRKFSLDGLLLCDVGAESIIMRVALPLFVVPAHAGLAQAILEFVAPQLQIGSGRMLYLILRGTTACHNNHGYQ